MLPFLRARNSSHSVANRGSRGFLPTPLSCIQGCSHGTREGAATGHIHPSYSGPCSPIPHCSRNSSAISRQKWGVGGLLEMPEGIGQGGAHRAPSHPGSQPSRRLPFLVLWYERRERESPEALTGIRYLKYSNGNLEKKPQVGRRNRRRGDIWAQGSPCDARHQHQRECVCEGACDRARETPQPGRGSRVPGRWSLADCSLPSPPSGLPGREQPHRDDRPHQSCQQRL